MAEGSGNNQPTVESVKKFDPTELSWMVRPCEAYHTEYVNCSSWRARLFQYYVYGETQNCEPWKEDRDNCHEWETQRLETAASSIIMNERKRRLERLGPHVRNKVWEKREKPPADWNKPLPDFMDKTKYSYITTQMRIEKEGYFARTEQGKSLCSIQ